MNTGMERRSERDRRGKGGRVRVLTSLHYFVWLIGRGATFH